LPRLLAAAAAALARSWREWRSQRDELCLAWQAHQDNPLPALWAQSQQRASERRPWYRRNPLLMSLCTLLSLSYSALILWFLSLHLEYSHSAVLTRSYILDSLRVCLELLIWPLLAVILVFLFIRIFEVLQFSLGLLADEKRTRVETLDDMLSSSQLRDADILVATALHCLGRLALPLLLLGLGEGALVVDTLLRGDATFFSDYFSASLPASLPWHCVLLSGLYAFFGSILLGLLASILLILLMLSLGRGLGGLFVSAAAGVNMLIQLGAAFWLQFWASSAAESAGTRSLHPWLDARVLLVALAITAVQLFAFWAALLIARESLRIRQLATVALWPLLALITVLMFGAIGQLVENSSSRNDVSTYAFASPLLLLQSAQVLQPLPPATALQYAVPEFQALILMQLVIMLLLIWIALPAALGAIHQRRGGAQ
jgi:hypothetical protein